MNEEVSLIELIEANIRKRRERDFSLDNIPLDVLQRIKQIAQVNEEQARIAIECYREPSKEENSVQGLCNCTTSMFHSGGFEGIDCYLCGGYSY